MVAPFRRIASEAASERSWALFWSILDGFVLTFYGFGHHFRWILVASLQQHLQNVKAAWHKTK